MQRAMNMLVRHTVAIVVTLGMTRAALAAEPSAHDIMERNYHAVQITSLDAQASMVLINERGEERHRKMTVVQKLLQDGVNSSLRIDFKYPADIAGTTFLEIQNSDQPDNLWIYLPALKKTRRISAQNQNDSFMGSDFSYGDILLPEVSLYLHTLLRSEQLNGQDCYVVESTPVDAGVRDDYGYARKVSWIDKSNFVEARVDYFDVDGQPLKTQTTANAHLVDPQRQRWLVLERTMTNHQTRHKTQFGFQQFKIGTKVPDQVFLSNRLGQE